MKQTIFKEDFKMGIGKTDDRNTVVLKAPSFDCGWYWGFGYLSNKWVHYHMNGLMITDNLFDGLKKEFGDSLVIKNEKDLWTFCELMKTFYTLKDTAEVLERGGSNYGDNPIKNIIQNKKEANRINKKVMIALFDAIENILVKYR